ncbi:hypothetical protein N9067_02210, partial [Akkermansiaceae bacterium]|nr:hypothetical protein [Akkermansiaceae bacterium]
GSEEEDRKIEHETIPEIELRSPSVLWVDQKTESDEKEVGKVRSKMRRGFQLDSERVVTLPNIKKALLAALNGTLCPAVESTRPKGDSVPIPAKGDASAAAASGAGGAGAGSDAA